MIKISEGFEQFESKFEGLKNELLQFHMDKLVKCIFTHSTTEKRKPLRDEIMFLNAVYQLFDSYGSDISGTDGSFLSERNNLAVDYRQELLTAGSLLTVAKTLLDQELNSPNPPAVNLLIYLNNYNEQEKLETTGDTPNWDNTFSNLKALWTYIDNNRNYLNTHDSLTIKIEFHITMQAYLAAKKVGNDDEMQYFYKAVNNLEIKLTNENECEALGSLYFSKAEEFLANNDKANALYNFRLAIENTITHFEQRDTDASAMQVIRIHEYAKQYFAEEDFSRLEESVQKIKNS